MTEPFYCPKCEKTFHIEISRKEASKISYTKPCEKCGTNLQLLTENNF